MEDRLVFTGGFGKGLTRQILGNGHSSAVPITFPAVPGIAIPDDILVVTLCNLEQCSFKKCGYDHKQNNNL